MAFFVHNDDRGKQSASGRGEVQNEVPPDGGRKHEAGLRPLKIDKDGSVFF